MRTAHATAPPNPVERIPGGGAGPTRSRETVVRLDSHPACASSDPELFFAPDTDHGTAGRESRESTADREYREAAAVEVCAGCPVRAECLQGALERGEEYGVWGGLTEDEYREALERWRAEWGVKRPRRPQEPSTTTNRRVAPCGTPTAYKRHIRRHEPVDAACSEAYNAANRERYQRRADAEELAS